MNFVRSHILVCGGTGCSSSKSPEIIKEFEKQLKAQGLDDEVKVIQTGCFGLCELGPIVVVYPEGTFYSRMTVNAVKEIVEEHILKGRLVQRLLYKEPGTEGIIHSLNNTEFYKKQHRIALRNCGVINPEDIDEYIAFDGYKALGDCLTKKTPAEVIDIMLASGLRGRGGGFPAPA
jgi:NADP-reducing hydrogenase subunit HndC